MKTTVEKLEGSRVQIDAEVPSQEVADAIQKTAVRLGGEMKIPGFRKGKVPPEMVLQRVGREGVLTEAIEEALADWYEAALLGSAIDPIGSPRIRMGDLPAEGEDLKFSIEVGVLPEGKLDEWKGLEVGKEESKVPDGAVDAEIDRLREGFTKLNTVDRPGKEGDVLLIDFKGTVDGEEFEGGEGKDYLLELGAGQVVPGFEESLMGASAGESHEASFDFPDDYHAEALRGKSAKFAIEVKEVREKELPELDDDFASEASEFDTLEELRAEIEKRILEVVESQAMNGFRERALDAAAANVDVKLSDELILARAEETWDRAARTLAQQGVDPQRYLTAQGATREQMVEQARPEAERGLRREVALQAVADAEDIQITEEDMLEALKVPEGHEDHGHPEPPEALAELRETGRDKLVERDLKMRKALDLIADAATPISMADHEERVKKAEAAEKIWTPEKEREEKGGLWTPGDPEP
jgi:trigger factor